MFLRVIKKITLAQFFFRHGVEQECGTRLTTAVTEACYGWRFCVVVNVLVLVNVVVVIQALLSVEWVTVCHNAIQMHT